MFPSLCGCWSETRRSSDIPERRRRRRRELFIQQQQIVSPLGRLTESLTGILEEKIKHREEVFPDHEEDSCRGFNLQDQTEPSDTPTDSVQG